MLLGKILKVVNDEDSSPQDLYRMVSHDQSLAERVVRVANSAMFGHSGDVRDIQQAVMFLGFDKIKTISMGMTVMDFLPTRSSFKIKNLWVHSYEVAFLAAAVSDMLPVTSPRESFLSGLLHDIGRVIFCRMDPDKFLVIETADDMFDREIEAYGCTHAHAGLWFAEEIGMPAEILAAIKFHHRPASARDYKDSVAIVALAEALSRRFSPRLEDDGVWTHDHDAILLEYSLSNEDLVSIGSRLIAAGHEIENFF